ncbi:tripartite ATP-independent transporter DctP family solute receptor [Rhodothalassium salexigens DSM 2132]|uniref:Tripartite ATP-independent transporter DctP family solute receptor n=1 Tax=Rhodothalassium salexigens DSM 2132 TaxID=1188247 RepID=A0A4R2PQN2_RHOSA|nr:TRAP transporter substrate-binding protein DctP [Rhodothalassium salexigens]MBB4210436.1 tripartite ATP-independent transporter DctP family solute receptor [Rhodothalassium salexigens DSM 2132]MBK1638240.1 hypothetical protein [Rhodothalassium salexigens DSM 2132]TCP38007.1 tripartite ATP-independent transporter DctP family solute receptor [Rhodothalassium salexigens DSM 2132]
MRRNALLNLIFAAIAAVCAMGVWMAQAQSAAHTLRIGFLASPDDEDYDGALVFKHYVERKSAGRIAVEIFPSGQFCGNGRECIEGLQTGTLDIHMTTVGGLGLLFGPAQVLDLPYAFADDGVAQCVFDGPLIDQLRDAVLDAGLGMRLMAASNTGGWRNFATRATPVRHPDDLEGLKIRTTPAPLQQELVRRLGARPTPVTWSELYTALATGVVDGTKNGVQDLVGMRFHEHLKHIALDRHSYMGALWWVSEQRWQMLPEPVRRIVHDGFQQLELVTRALPIRAEVDAYRAFEAAGGTVHELSPEARAAFRARAAGMRTWFAERYDPIWLARLDRAIAACEAGRQADFDAVAGAPNRDPTPPRD